MDNDLQAADLRERLAQLEAENSELRNRLTATDATAAPQVEDAPKRKRGPGWTVLATVLIVLGCLLAPVAVITGWAKSTLTDTDTFVATYAPLAHDPGVQAYVVDQAATTIDQNIDIEGLTSEVIDGIKALGTRPRASTALDALKGPATQGIETLIRDGITAFVGSDAFTQTWERALRVSHTQLVATLTNDPQALAPRKATARSGSSSARSSRTSRRLCSPATSLSPRGSRRSTGPSRSRSRTRFRRYRPVTGRSSPSAAG